MMGTHSVIGGNGTIGAETVRSLVELGHDVRILQRNPRAVTGRESLVKIDVFDLEGSAKTVEGADIVHLLLGLPYEGKVWTEGLLGYTVASGA
jgi:uncharacterized protein YbjT (DUF2867 family)